jgi:alcohol dehydrogenase class IV
MEYFDPKTRPAAILLDGTLLAGTPAAVVRSTATTVLCAGLAGVATSGRNTIAEGDRLQSFRLALRAYRSLADLGEMDTDARFDVAVAAFLQNRAEDADGRLVRTGAFAGNYALSTALHIRFPHVGQGEATSVLASTVMRSTTDPSTTEAQRVADALGLWEFGVSPSGLAQRIAAAVDDLFVEAGAPIRLRELGIDRSALDDVAAETVKNFNFDAGVVSAQESVRRSRELLEAAWE